MNTLTEQILTQLGSIVVILDERGNAEYVSPSAENMLGFAPEKLLGDGWLTYTRADENERINVVRDLIKIRKGLKHNVSYERLLRTASGGQKWIHWNTVASPEGKLIGIGYDITRRKQREDLLARKTEDLRNRNQEVESGLRYAQRIQSAILPDVKELKRVFSDAFVFYKPKDIVSGDFWWMHETDDAIFTAVVDCTGHGIPGALMSVLAHSIFREVFLNRNLSDPAELLNEIDKELFIALNREHSHKPYPDGMDVALCGFDKRSNRLDFAGAYRPLVIARNGALIEYAASRYPIGYYCDVQKQFTTWSCELQKGDCIYLFSDGYADQFGGEKEKKLNKRGFRELLNTIQSMNGEEQHGYLEYALLNWKQDYEQTDDITVMGLRVG
jgi:PAS domain S-box-containing protein